MSQILDGVEQLVEMFLRLCPTDCVCLFSFALAMLFVHHAAFDDHHGQSIEIFSSS